MPSLTPRGLTPRGPRVPCTHPHARCARGLHQLHNTAQRVAGVNDVLHLGAVEWYGWPKFAKGRPCSGQALHHKCTPLEDIIDAGCPHSASAHRRRRMILVVVARVHGPRWATRGPPPYACVWRCTIPRAEGPAKAAAAASSIWSRHQLSSSASTRRSSKQMPWNDWLTPPHVHVRAQPLSACRPCYTPAISSRWAARPLQLPVLLLPRYL